MKRLSTNAAARFADDVLGTFSAGMFADALGRFVVNPIGAEAPGVGVKDLTRAEAPGGSSFITSCTAWYLACLPRAGIDTDRAEQKLFCDDPPDDAFEALPGLLEVFFLGAVRVGTYAGWNSIVVTIRRSSSCSSVSVLAVLVPDPLELPRTAGHNTPPDFTPEYPILESVEIDKVLLEDAVEGAANGSPRCAIAPTGKGREREQ